MNSLNASGAAILMLGLLIAGQAGAAPQPEPAPPTANPADAAAILNKTAAPTETQTQPLPPVTPTVPRDSTVAPTLAPPPTSTTPQAPAALLPSAPKKPVQPMTRAEMARLMVTWFQLAVEPHSDFPVFVDVPLTHPDYAVIDRVRRLHLMLADKGGYFHPDAPATRLDAWMALAKLLFPKNTTSDQEARAILANYPGQQWLAPYEKRRVARLFAGRVLTPERDVPIQPDMPVDAGWMQATLAQLQANRQFLKDQEKQAAASQSPAINVPAGIRLSVTPSQAIAASDIGLGAQYYWQLTQAVTLPDGTMIPTDSSLKSTVVAASQNNYVFGFESISSVQTGQLFKLKANLTVHLEPRGKGNLLKPEQGNASLIITGNTFTMVTEALPPPPAFDAVKETVEKTAPAPPASTLPTPAQPMAEPTSPSRISPSKPAASR